MGHVLEHIFTPVSVLPLWCQFHVGLQLWNISILTLKNTSPSQGWCLGHLWKTWDQECGVIAAASFRKKHMFVSGCVCVLDKQRDRKPLGIGLDYSRAHRKCQQSTKWHSDNMDKTNAHTLVHTQMHRLRWTNSYPIFVPVWSIGEKY